jgi:hypothetical protein
MKHETFSTSEATSEPAFSLDVWTHARKRADNYLKLHQLPTEQRDELLTQVAQKLTRTSPCSEQELIQRFISTVQLELAAQQAANHQQTGPRFERSSIRVAPLRAITLLPNRAQLRASH